MCNTAVTDLRIPILDSSPSVQIRQTSRWSVHVEASDYLECNTVIQPMPVVCNAGGKVIMLTPAARAELSAFLDAQNLPCYCARIEPFEPAVFHKLRRRFNRPWFTKHAGGSMAKKAKKKVAKGKKLPSVTTLKKYGITAT